MKKSSERRSLPIVRRLLLIIISILLLAFQLGLVALIVIASYGYASGFQLAFVVVDAGGLVLSLTIIFRNINANYKLTWCILIMLLPLFFGAIYIFNLISKHRSKKQRMKINYEIPIEVDSSIDELINDDLDLYRIALTANNIAFSPVLNNSSFKFFKDANLKNIDMVENLKKAKYCILLEYFIISNGRLTDELYEILKVKGEEGVQIRILYDSLGSGRTSKILKKLATIPNCEVQAYEVMGLRLNLLYNYRNHRKLCIIDYNIAYCGGDNLADEYVHYIERFGYWRDNAGRYIGEAAVVFAKQFEKIWYASTKKKLEFDYKNYKIDKFENDSYIMPFTDGPFYEGYLAYDVFTALIMNAKKSIYISTPYFIVDDALLNLITLKCRQGVDVRILMPNIPDKKSAFYMGREKYRPILENGGRVFQFTSGFNHAKNIIIDNKYAYIGTVNMDYRSLFLHFECGAIIKSSEVDNITLDYMYSINESTEITLDIWKKRPFLQRCIAFILNLFAPMF